ncbi:MAG: hypothetical protein ACM3JC_00350 [Rudaea sp.]
MIRTFAAALIASLVAASTALAQAGAPAAAAPAAAAPVAATPAASATSGAPAAAAPVLRQDARAHDDADARECLEFLTNIGVIRCAEKYRSNARRPQH